MHPNQKAGFGKKGYFFVNHWVSKGDGQKMHPEKYFCVKNNQEMRVTVQGSNSDVLI